MRQLGWWSLVLSVAACGGEKRPDADAGGAGLVAPVVVAENDQVPPPVTGALRGYTTKRLGAVRDVRLADPAAIDAANQACKAGDVAGCHREVAQRTGAATLVSLSISRQGDDCAVTVSLVTPNPSPDAEPPPPASIQKARCHLEDLQQAAEAGMRAIPQLKGLKANPPSPPPACDNACTAGELSCEDRSLLHCSDDDWNGCLDWWPTPCPSDQACSRGACIAELPDMVFVPEGRYLMGADEKQMQLAMSHCQARSYGCLESWWRTEAPAHWVQVSGFFIDKTEVTNAAYDACVKAGACKKQNHGSCRGWSKSEKKWKSGGDVLDGFLGPNDPAACVTYDEADKFCHWSKKRLPTEAEWEKAARGTDGRLYPWGNDKVDGTRANCCDKQCGSIAGAGWRSEGDLDDQAPMVNEVGTYPAGASPFGALDMSGNVWEWVADWYDENYYRVSERKDPRGPDPDENVRVLRGGSWSNEPDSLRSGYRYSMDPGQRLTTIGFRCAYP